MSTLVTGAHLHGRYRVVRAIGHGGMGAVYEAIDTRLKNTVAVKQMTITGPDVDRAFRQEAEILAGLRHPALPVVIDYFEDTGEQFLVMQYIEGEDLAGLLERLDRPCDVDDVIAWGRTILEALSYLHSHRPPIVHRDIKPANLKLTPGGEIVLLDFGLAKGRLDALTGTTRGDRSLYGFTLKYAPIEQIEGRGTDARSDLYALAATLYHLVTGSPPASALARATAMRSGQSDPLVDAHVLNPAVSESFSETLRRALAVEPAPRIPSAADMLVALNVVPDRIRDRGHADAAPPAARRVDAAMPSQTVVGQPADLIVQVRFTHSPLLGLEDWPTARRPEEIEQGSEPLNVAYPVNPATGALMPARVRIRVVAPQFTIDGETAFLIEVPPREYSKRLVFLMTPQRAGPCRVHVEVYGPDDVLLGSIPVESEAASSGIVQLRRVAHLVLNVFARPSAPGPSAPGKAVVLPPVEPRPDAAPRVVRDPSLMSSVTPPAVPTATRRSGRRWILGAAPVVVLAAGGWLTITMMRSTALDGPVARGTEIVAFDPAPPDAPAPSPTPPPMMPAAPPPPAASRPPAPPPVSASPAPAPASPARPTVSPPTPVAADPPATRPAPPATATPAVAPPPAPQPGGPGPIQPFLTELTEAYRTRSANAVRNLWRDAPASETDFTGVQAYDVLLDACEIVQEPTTATATCTRVTRITPIAGEPRSDSRRVRYVLAWRTNVLIEGVLRRTGWFIERVEVE